MKWPARTSTTKLEEQMKASDPMRHHAEHQHLSSAFGADSFGKAAEGLARFFGTAPYLVGQSIVVICWIIINAIALLSADFDPYPFILLNLAFSLQAAYAAPLILLAQTRQADRDKAWTESDAHHREELSENTLTMLRQNTDITEQVRRLSESVNKLTQEIHEKVVAQA